MQNLEQNSDMNMTPEEVIQENLRIRKMLKGFSDLLNSFLEKKPMKKVQEATVAVFSNEVLEKRIKNNRKVLVNLGVELESLRKKERRMQRFENLEPEIQKKREKIKSLYTKIHELNIKKVMISKELIENGEDKGQQTEVKRLDREVQRIETRNQEIRVRNGKLEEKIDKWLGMYDDRKEKLKKAETVAVKMKICLDPSLKDRYTELQDQKENAIKTFKISNKHDELSYTSLEKSVAEAKSQISQTNSQIESINKKIAYQNQFISEKSVESPQIAGILAKNSDPLRLFLEKDVRPKPIVLKQLKKPMSLMDLNRKNQTLEADKGIMSLDKQLQSKEKSTKGTIFTVPFRIRKGKIQAESLERKLQEEKKIENRVWAVEGGVKTEPIEGNISKNKEDKIEENLKEEDKILNDKKTKENPVKSIEKVEKKSTENTNDKDIMTNFKLTTKATNQKETTNERNLTNEKNLTVEKDVTNDKNTEKEKEKTKGKETPKGKSFNFNQMRNGDDGRQNKISKNDAVPLKKSMSIEKKIVKNQDKKTENKGNDLKKGLFEDTPENEFEIPEIQTVNNPNTHEKSTKLLENSNGSFENANSLLKDVVSPKNKEQENKNDFFADLQV